MKVIKIVLGGLIALIVIILLAALFLPSEYSIVRSIEINRTPDIVFEQVANLENWPKWNPWSEMEPAAKNTFGGSMGTVGSSWTWDGEKIGRGTLTLQKIEPTINIQSKIDFFEPREGTAMDEWIFEETVSGTKVSWRNSGSLEYPIGRFFGLILESQMLGPQFEHGLKNLKKLSEELPIPEIIPETGTEQ